jgi:hypothetical protein
MDYLNVIVNLPAGKLSAGKKNRSSERLAEEFFLAD